MWIFYSLFFAVWSAVQTFLTKNLTKKFSPLALLYIFFLFNIPITFVLLLFLGGIPEVTQNFYLYIGIAGALDALAFVCSILAISRSSISLIAPIASFSPVFRLSTLFIIVLGGVFLKEKRIKERFLGASVMLLGAILLAM